MSQQSESSDIGHRMYALNVTHLRADGVELRHRVHHFLIRGRIEFLALESRAVDAGSQTLGQDDLVLGARRVVAYQPGWIDKTNRDQAVYRLRRIDRMSASHRDSGRGADGCSPCENILYDI